MNYDFHLKNYKNYYSETFKLLRYEVFTAVKIRVKFFWVVMLCSVVVGYQHFRGPHCLYLYGVTLQKNLT
jgi:hypothetical protein